MNLTSAGATTSHRPHSIKTRIKTIGSVTGCISRPTLTDHIPLKQGLRLGVPSYARNQLVVLTGHIPLKQGLRPDIMMITPAAVSSLTGHIPLKQGLRLDELVANFNDLILTGHIPLKQGLRLITCNSNAGRSDESHRPHSIKTRIKT